MDIDVFMHNNRNLLNKYIGYFFITVIKYYGKGNL